MKLSPLFYAYKCLDSIIRNGAYSGIELNRFLNTADKNEKALITRIVYGVLDKQIELDYIIHLYAKKIKPSIMPAIEIGVYMLKYMNIPDYAVVNETVELIKDIGKNAYSGFVNALLKNISLNIKNETIVYPDKINEIFSIKYSFPLWAVDLLIAQIGLEETEAFLLYTEDNSFTHIRINPSSTSIEEFSKLINDKKCDYRKSLFKDTFYIKNQDLCKIDGSYYTIQSLGSIIVCQNVGKSIAQKVLDVCAAPGGKSICIAQLFSMNVTACDIHQHRVDLIKSYAKKMGTNINLCLNDATKFNEEFYDTFDCVLCDVPCSGFGVISSKPDIKRNKTLNNVIELSELQYNILNQSKNYVKLNGCLIYSTCTIFDKENKNNIEKFLCNNKNFILDKAWVPDSLGTAPYIDDKMVQFMPYRDGVDGFFIAVLRRIK